MVRLLLIASMATLLSGCVDYLLKDAIDAEMYRLQFQGRDQVWIVPDATAKDRQRIQDPKTGQYTHTIMPDVLYPDRKIIRKGIW